MTDEDKNHLLESILGSEDLDHLRQETLSRGLQEMRRRRHRLLAGRAFVMAVPVLLLATMVFHPRLQAPIQAPASAPPAQAAKAESKVEYITADQLFALFPNRPMALVGKPGQQQLIVLDGQPEQTSQ